MEAYNTNKELIEYIKNTKPTPTYSVTCNVGEEEWIRSTDAWLDVGVGLYIVMFDEFDYQRL